MRLVEWAAQDPFRQKIKELPKWRSLIARAAVIQRRDPVQLMRFPSAYLSALYPPFRFGFTAVAFGSSCLARSHSIASDASRFSSSVASRLSSRYRAASRRRPGR